LAKVMSPPIGIDAKDGIADGPSETYALELPLEGAGEHTISLRAIDGSGNVSSARVVVRR